MTVIGEPGPLDALGSSEDLARAAADRDADTRYRIALARTGKRFADVSPDLRRAAERDPAPFWRPTCHEEHQP